MKLVWKFSVVLVVFSLLAQPTSARAGGFGENNVDFENAGGKWMPHQISEFHADTLRQLGLEIDPAVFDSPLNFPLNSIVWLGFCSASFVSPYGLVVTNYHCVKGYLQSNSTPEQDLLHVGFNATTLGDEKSAGPKARLFVTTDFSDVTVEVMEGIAGITDGLKRFKAIDQRRKEIIAKREAANPGHRCDIAAFYGGAKYYLIEKLEIKDVRLVYAPHRGVGELGRDPDNWMWPRHTGDFSFVRAYVSPDGKGVPYAKKNVPYQPKTFLKIASEPVKKGDLVFVAGFPGTTSRLVTASELEDLSEWSIPRTITQYKEHLDLLGVLTQDNPELNIKAEDRKAGMENYLKNYEGKLEGIRRENLLARKYEQEQTLSNWISADPVRSQKYGQAITQMNALFEDRRAKRDRQAAYYGVESGSALLSSAMTIVWMAHQRAKPDAEREEKYQQRKWEEIEQSLQSIEKTYDRRLDQPVLKLYLQRAMRLPRSKQPNNILSLILKKGRSERAVDQSLDALYDRTELNSAEKRVELFRSGTIESLKRSSDPFIKLAVALYRYDHKLDTEAKKFLGQMSLLRPDYNRAMLEMNAGNLAPDANSTLRVSFGTVKGYTPLQEGAKPYEPFTYSDEMVAKVDRHKAAWPYDGPVNIVEAARKHNFGAWSRGQKEGVTVDFLSDLDITGGNSGSATMNKRAELTGLAFDGNLESVASDFVFMPKITRTIHVSTDYIRWVLDVDGAQRVLEEMGQKPSVERISCEDPLTKR